VLGLGPSVTGFINLYRAGNQTVAGHRSPNAAASAAEEETYLASMKSDLRNSATAQEGYFADNQAYLTGSAGNVAGVERPLMPLGNYLPSSGVTVTFTATDGTGWSGVATHIGTTRTCAIFIGVAAVAPAMLEGEPRCTP
jgi:hypothetical protein